MSGGLLADLSTYAALGALGSVHCAGMCGGFAVAVTAGARRPRARWTAYALGKALAYAVLGTAVALLASAAARRGAAAAAGDPLATARSALAWVAGLCLVALGVAQVARRGRVPFLASDRLARLLAGPGALLTEVRGLPGWLGGFGTGFLTGFLPCGLSWSALALAIASPPAVAALGLLVFGLATAPSLGLVAAGARALPAAWRGRAAPLLGWALIALGLLTCLRGGLPAPLRGAQSAVLPECCAPADSNP